MRFACEHRRANNLAQAQRIHAVNLGMAGGEKAGRAIDNLLGDA